MNSNTGQGWLTASSLVRQTAEAVLRAAGRRHLAQFDQLAPDRCQRRILLGLLHQARTTRFGREHDFRRIRTVADYRRLVPLWTRSELWRDYWQPVYPHLAGATWPGPSLNGHADGNDSLRLTPPSSALQAAHRSALRTAFALVTHCQRRTRLLSGNLLFLTEEGPSSRTTPSILAERLPLLLRPYVEANAEILAERWAALPVTGLIGPAERLLILIEQVKQLRGKRCLRDVWPQLSVILYVRRPSAEPAARLRTEAGEDVLVLEMAGRAEGPLAIEDPRHGAMRLLCNHGVYVEFVPLDRVDEPRSPRFGIEEIALDTPYELAVTSPAGLWACRLGRTVRLLHRDPPLLRFDTVGILPASAVGVRRATRRTDLILTPPPLPEPHPQSAGSPAAPPETIFHSPWSTRADRG